MSDLDSALTAPQMALKWQRPVGGYHSTACGRFMIYKASRDRKRPLWKIVRNGIGLRDLAATMSEAKSKAEALLAEEHKPAPSDPSGLKRSDATGVAALEEKGGRP